MANKEKKANKENKHFFRDFKAEIKKVIWPSSKQLVNTTVAIITMVIVVSIIVFGLDLIFDAGNKYGLTKLQETVQGISEKDDNGEETSENVDEVEPSEDADATESDSAEVE